MPGHVNRAGLDPSKRFYMLVRSLLPLNGEMMTRFTSVCFRSGRSIERVGADDRVMQPQGSCDASY